MTWPWRRPPRPDSQGLQDAKAALAKARADEPRVANVVEAHRRKREHNHFGPTIARVLGAQGRHS